MDFNFLFNDDGSLITPTFAVASKTFDESTIKIIHNPVNINISDPLDDAPKITFDIYKYDNGQLNPTYDFVKNFKLVVCLEIDTYFEAMVTENESDKGVYKTVELTEYTQAGLSNVHVYGLNVNTEDSIIYDDNYEPTVLYKANDPDHSLLHRVLSFAPIYRIRHVASTVQNIQRTFQFNDQTVLECLKNIAEEESLHLEFYMGEISVYDVMSNCGDCGYRGMFHHTCPKCNSVNVIEGFGDDTTVLVSADALGSDLSISTNPDSIANCYHIQAGDDVMTAAVRQCNPNGTGYIWSFTNEMLAEFSEDTRQAIETYNTTYKNYMTIFDYLDMPAATYNNLITKYKAVYPDLDVDTISHITGYPELIKVYYQALDFYNVVKTTLMPSDNTNNITARSEATRLYQQMNNTTVAVGNLDNLSLAAASTAVMNNARLIVNTIYNVTVQTQTLTNTTWTGTLMLQSFYDKDDTAVTQMMTVTINDNLSSYVSGKVMKTLYNTTQGQSLVVAMFSQTTAQVQTALTYYSYDELININKAFNGVLEVLSKFKADDPQSDLYNSIYVPTKAKLDLVQAELLVREQDLTVVKGICDTASGHITNTQEDLNLENYLNEASEMGWQEINIYRREANYSDNNYVSTTYRRKFSYTDSAYISDSLTSAEIVQRAYEFLVQAEQKLAENNKYSYQINSTIKNLFLIPEFREGHEYDNWSQLFKCGNWIRVKSESGEIYTLRLTNIEFSLDDPENISVSFSDISNTNNAREAQRIIAQSVDLVKNQKRYTNQATNKFTSITDDIQCDYVVNDSFAYGNAADNVEILGDQMVTTFNVLDGLIQGKISANEAYSLIQQELDKITLVVNNPANSHTSSITIKYDGVTIMTSNDITLGGNVVFTSQLQDGVTIINGSNIKTGVIQSEYYTDYGGTYSVQGSKFDLNTGSIKTPGLYINGETGIIYIKEGGFIGDSEILTADYSTAVNHSNHTWKLRSAAINAYDNTRYYAYLTKNKNFIVSNDELGGHSSDNDVTDLCQIGSKGYPWNAGYFNNLYVNRHSVIPEGVKLKLKQNDWEDFGDGLWTIDLDVDVRLEPGKTFFSIGVTNEDSLELVHKHNIQAGCTFDGVITIISNGCPDDDVNIILLLEDYKLADLDNPVLSASFDSINSQLSLLWDSPNDGSYLVNWVKDEIVIGYFDDNNNFIEEATFDNVSGQTFMPDWYDENPLIIGSMPGG